MRPLTRLLSVSAALALGACAAPEPLPLAQIEALDHRAWASPAEKAPKASAKERLAKDSLTLEDVLAIAEAMNPELAIARREIDIATAAIWEAKLYPNPSLLVEFEDYRIRDGATSGRMERSAGLSVPVVIGGRIGAATTLAEKERERAAVEYLWRRREILFGVKKAFLGLLASRRTSEVAREARDLARASHEVTETRFRAQAVPEMESLKSAVALAKADSDLRLAENGAALALKSLHAAMGNTDLTIEKVEGTLPDRYSVPALESLRGHVLALHPLLEAATRAKEASELELDLAKAERIPDFAVDLTVGRDPDDHGIVEGGLTIPLPLFNRNQGKIARAEARIDQAARRHEAARNDVLLRLSEAYRNLTSAQDRATVYREVILPKAVRALEQANDGYRLGKFGQLDVLDAQRTLAEARAAQASAVSELNQAAVELEKLTGMPLEALR